MSPWKLLFQWSQLGFIYGRSHGNSISNFSMDTDIDPSRTLSGQSRCTKMHLCLQLLIGGNLCMWSIPTVSISFACFLSNQRSRVTSLRLSTISWVGQLWLWLSVVEFPKKHHFSFLGRMPQISHIGSGLPSGVPEPLTYKVVQLGARAHKQTESRI